MWGTPSLSSSSLTRPGITPTCVGNTSKARSHRPNNRDHPHLCGEHLAFAVGRWPEKGSPPPVWGTRMPNFGQKGLRGITPTCVGNTISGRCKRAAPGDHPHLCGEHGVGLTTENGYQGSPPPVWGTQLVLAVGKHEKRITPTCVGNTH